MNWWRGIITTTVKLWLFIVQPIHANHDTRDYQLLLTAKKWQDFIDAGISWSVRCITSKNINSILQEFKMPLSLCPLCRLFEGPFCRGPEALGMKTQRGASVWSYGCGGGRSTKYIHFILLGTSPIQGCANAIVPWEELGPLKAIVRKVYHQLNFQGISRHSRVVKSLGAPPMGDCVLDIGAFPSGVPLITPLPVMQDLLNRTHIVSPGVQPILTKNWGSLVSLTRLVYDINCSLSIHVCLWHATMASDGLWKPFWVPPLNPTQYDLALPPFQSSTTDSLVMVLLWKKFWISVPLYSTAEANNSTPYVALL